METSKTQETQLGLIISQQVNGKELGRAQKQFNDCIAKIAALEQEIAHNQEMLQKERSLINGMLLPLYEALNLAKFETAQALDKVLDYPSRNRKLSSSQIGIMEEMIVMKCFELLEEGMTIEGLETLHDKYAPRDYKEIKQAALKAKLEAAARMFQKMTGICVKVTPELMDEEKFQEHLQALLLDYDNHKEKKAEQPKSSEKEQRATKQKAATQKTDKSLRNVYTSLVKTVHPDLEQDEQEKNRKTEVMQRITAAYEIGDLPTLLSIELELHQAGASMVASMGDEELKDYLKILKKRLASLSDESASLLNSFRTIDNTHKSIKKVPEALIERYVKQDAQAIKSAIKAYQRELSALLTPSILPQLVKEYKDMLKEHYR